ncbi:hypothetical protein NMY22_g18428 [Coprinellus aureogranulatus]|nr:hypothetical protein NMY22_g18428 [Coprinellus aureogranulatus]
MSRQTPFNEAEHSNNVQIPKLAGATYNFTTHSEHGTVYNGNFEGNTFHSGGSGSPSPPSQDMARDSPNSRTHRQRQFTDEAMNSGYPSPSPPGRDSGEPAGPTPTNQQQWRPRAYTTDIAAEHYGYSTAPCGMGHPYPVPHVEPHLHSSHVGRSHPEMDPARHGPYPHPALYASQPFTIGGDQHQYDHAQALSSHPGHAAFHLHAQRQPQRGFTIPFAQHGVLPQVPAQNNDSLPHAQHYAQAHGPPVTPYEFPQPCHARSYPPELTRVEVASFNPLQLTIHPERANAYAILRPGKAQLRHGISLRLPINVFPVRPAFLNMMSSLCYSSPTFNTFEVVETGVMRRYTAPYAVLTVARFLLSGIRHAVASTKPRENGIKTSKHATEQPKTVCITVELFTSSMPAHDQRPQTVEFMPAARDFTVEKVELQSAGRDMYDGRGAYTVNHYSAPSTFTMTTHSAHGTVFNGTFTGNQFYSGKAASGKRQRVPHSPKECLHNDSVSLERICRGHPHPQPQRPPPRLHDNASPLPHMHVQHSPQPSLQGIPGPWPPQGVAHAMPDRRQHDGFQYARSPESYWTTPGLPYGNEWAAPGMPHCSSLPFEGCQYYCAQ